MMDDELDAALAALRQYDPTPGFADRVMARVAVPQPVAVRPRPSLVVGLPFVIAIAGSMLASMVWTWRHQTALTSFGRRAMAQISVWVSDALQVAGQYPLTRQLPAHATELMIALVLGSLLYVGGLVAFFRLMGEPTSRVAYARH